MDFLAITGTVGAPEPAGGSSELVQILRTAESEMRDLRDEYVSTEHLLLALAAHPGTAGDVPRSGGANREAMRVADRMYVLVGGTRRFEGRPADIEDDRELMQLYLGAPA